MAGGEGFDLSGALVQRVGAVDLPFLAACALAGDEVDGDVLLEGVDIGVGAHPFEQAGLHRMAGGVGGVHHAAPGMAAFACQMQFAGCLRGQAWKVTPLWVTR